MTEITKEAAREQVAQLVERFRSRTRASLNEQETRLSFILPLFRALGWDIEDPDEMYSEEQISRGFVDFGFYVNHVPVFYLETKKASEKLEKPEHMRQAINYSYLKGVTWAVLTDFEGLMVFNADWKTKNPVEARFLDLKWEHYAEASFDDLWLLSKPAMMRHEIDAVAERYGKKNKKEDVTKQLFADLTKWRKALFREMFVQGTTLWSQDARQVDNAVQRFLDRLIFVRTVEDRDVEPNRLRAILRQSKRADLFPNLLKLFRDLDAVYNSNLFAEHQLDYLEVHDPNLLTDIIEGLYQAPGGFVDYDFNAIKADVLGAVYEQYLGFRAQDPEGKDALDLSKRSKRKAQGIYYTPQFVVRYIVRQTLGKLLDDGADPADLRILDPACGSGAFLIEAFDVLNDHYERTNPKATDAERQAWRWRILTHNLYGVDLDDQAVEVTRLNLMLRGAQERRKLPLLTNIKHGNSLISDSEIAGERAFDWAERFPDVMARGGFDVVVGNPPYVRQETLGAAFKEYAQEHYATYAGTADLYTYFIEKGISLLCPDGIYGVIVANKWMRANYGRALRQYLKQQRIEEIIDFGDLPVFEDATTYPCIIVARPGQQAEDGTTLQAAQVTTLEFDTLDTYLKPRRYPVRVASLDDNGWALSDSRADDLLAKVKDVGVSLVQYVGGKIYFGIKTGLNDAFIIDDATRRILISKNPQSSELLRPYVAGRDIKRYMPVQNDKYLIFMPNGWTERNARDVPSKWDWLREKYPAIAEHLLPFEAAAQKRYDKGEYWWELRPCRYYGILESPKIVYASLSERGSFTLDEQGILVDKTCYIIPSDDKYLLGILNSKLQFFYISSIAFQRRGGYLEYLSQYVSQLPIRTINFDDPADKAQHDRMVELVESMLRLKREHAAADAVHDDRRHELAQQIERTDREIDALVYALYGLTDAEIAIVEG